MPQLNPTRRKSVGARVDYVPEFYTRIAILDEKVIGTRSPMSYRAASLFVEDSYTFDSVEPSAFVEFLVSDVWLYFGLERYAKNAHMTHVHNTMPPKPVAETCAPHNLKFKSRALSPKSQN